MISIHVEIKSLTHFSEIVFIFHPSLRERQKIKDYTLYNMLLISSNDNVEHFTVPPFFGRDLLVLKLSFEQFNKFVVFSSPSRLHISVLEQMKNFTQKQQQILNCHLLSNWKVEEMICSFHHPFRHTTFFRISESKFDIISLWTSILSKNKNSFWSLRRIFNFMFNIIDIRNKIGNWLSLANKQSVEFEFISRIKIFDMIKNCIWPLL